MMNCGFVKAIFPRGRSRLSMSISNDIKGNYKSFYDQWHNKCTISCDITEIRMTEAAFLHLTEAEG